MNRILIVEDNKDINNILCEFLSEHNFIITKCFNGIEAVNKLKE